MADKVIAYSRARHPAVHRERVSLTALFFGLFAGPIVWSGNLMVTYGIATHACYPGHSPLDEVIHGFGFAWPLMIGCYVLALLVCVAAGVVSYRNWRVSGQEAHGHVHHLMEKGEGRTRYLGLIGICFSAIFFSAVLFGAIIFAIEPLCAH